MDKISHEMRLAQWTSIIRECNSSGISKKSWITANGIDEKQFYYWQRHVREEVFQELQPSLSPAQTFVELNVPSSTISHSERPEAILRIGNCVLEFQNTLSPILLQTIMQVMIREDLIIAGCWSHSRRKFADVVKAVGKDKAKDTLAYQALKQISAIYKIEEDLAELSPEERVKRRQLSVKPLVEAFFAWIHENRDKVPPKSETGKGFTY